MQFNVAIVRNDATIGQANVARFKQTAQCRRDVRGRLVGFVNDQDVTVLTGYTTQVLTSKNAKLKLPLINGESSYSSLPSTSAGADVSC